MATAMTFTTLQDDLRAYLERGGALTDPTVYAQLPRLINLAERKIARELKVQGFIEAVEFTLTVGQPIYAKPDRWRDTISMNLRNGSGARSPVFARGYEYLRTIFPDDSQTAQPQFYADYDYSHWLVKPAPDVAYTVEALYYALPVLLDDVNTTNWLTDYAPNLLLYGALLEATPFLKADERIPVWQAMYDRAAGMLNGEDLAKILDRAAVRKEA